MDSTVNRERQRQDEWDRYMRAFPPMPTGLMERIHDAERSAELIGCRVCELQGRVAKMTADFASASADLEKLNRSDTLTECGDDSRRFATDLFGTRSPDTGVGTIAPRRTARLD